MKQFPAGEGGVDYGKLFLVPAGMGAVAAVCLLLFFHPPATAPPTIPASPNPKAPTPPLPDSHTDPILIYGHETTRHQATNPRL
ncbi:MAG: hypothetical protein U0992_07060 [Planctomycetaceae bacterium]